MIDNLLNLAKSVESAWENLNNTEEAFSELCVKQLNSFGFDYPLDDFEKELGEWIKTTTLPQQLNLYNLFGQPPITLFNNGSFVLDLYFWVNEDTSLHDHAFSGAFKLLYGRSVHEIYDINTIKKFSEDMKFVEIEQSSAELLCPGSTQKIIRGDEFNHRLIHLDQPTITLCLRTVEEKEQTQWHYFANGLSAKKRELPDALIKKIYYYQYLFNRHQEQGMIFLLDTLKSLEPSLVLNLYEKLNLGDLGVEPETLDCFLGFMTTKYENEDWFQLYQQFYDDLQENYIELEGDDPASRFLRHVVNTPYPKETAMSLLEEIQGGELSLDQKTFLA